MRVVSGLNKADVKQARDDRAVQVLVIPTRIDNSESDHLNEFSSNFAEKVEHGGLVPELLQIPIGHCGICKSRTYLGIIIAKNA